MRVLIFILCVVGISECARILGIFPLPGKSHYTAGNTLMKLLAEKGHEITMVSHFSEKIPPKNFKNVVISTNSLKGDQVDFYNFNVHPFLQTYIYNTLGAPVINMTLSDPKFKELLSKKEKYDAIILEQFYSDGLRYLGVHFNAPLILYSAVDASSWTNPIVGNPAPPSYVPDLVVANSDDMGFFQRMNNAAIYVVSELIRNFVLLPEHDKLIKEHFPGAPDISEYYHNPAVVLLNGDISVNDPVPKVPAMIDVGGFHIPPPKPLPKDLQDILDNAKNGVIYFSMGSNLQSANMPKETLAILIKVFSTLKETVLWKWEEEHLPGKPDNVIIRNWLPQSDILAHKNIKLFITHGGIFSTIEAAYNAVPCLAFPIFADQTLNGQRATSKGYARWIAFKNIGEENLKTEIQELLTNPQYSENAKKRSLIMRDKPISSADKLIYWVEYVIRHKGADHLRVAAMKLSWYQYLLLDVIAFVLFCLGLFVLSVKYLVNYLICCCKKSSCKKVKQN